MIPLILLVNKVLWTHNIYYSFTQCTALLKELTNFTVPCIDLILACRSEDTKSHVILARYGDKFL